HRASHQRIRSTEQIGPGAERRRGVRQGGRMPQGRRGLCWAFMLIVTGTAGATAPNALAEAYHAIPGLSAQDRAVLAANMVQQGQYKNGLTEVMEAMTE